MLPPVKTAGAFDCAEIDLQSTGWYNLPAALKQNNSRRMKEPGRNKLDEGEKPMSETSAERSAKNRILWKRIGEYLLLILGGTAINLIISQIVIKLELPVYLDSIGTILVSITGGFIPGIVVGYATNLLKVFFDTNSVYYCAINVLIAVLASFLHRRKWFRSWGKILLSVPLFALIGGGLGSLMTWVLYGFGISEDFSGQLAKQIYDAGLSNALLAQMVSSILFDLLDKLIAVVTAVLIYRLMRISFKDRFRYHSWMQNQLSRDDFKEAHLFKPKGFSLRTKIVMIQSISILIIAAVTTGISYYSFHDEIIDNRVEMGKGVTHVLIANMDPDRVEEYLTLGDEAPGYKESETAMSHVRNSSSDIAYVYVYQIQEDGCHVVFDPDTPETPGADPGTVVPFDDEFRPRVPALLAGGEIKPIITNETFGWLLSIYTPVKNSEGKTVCYACVDIDMTKIMMDECTFLARILSLFISFAVLILAGFLWYAEHGVILPINSMANAAGSFAFNSEEEREDGAEQVHKLGIHTNDEIENLYDAIMKTTDDSVRYIAESQEKNAIISHMQENLIITMADLVESRDQNTGDHIKNTAAYTLIIMNELRKEGHYTDQLTDEFVADVFRSAPLHDIGKIRISDAVLNKPGKLTDEEFALMKQHTVFGGEVIEKTRPASANISYLDVAKDLATYHHEWWNGRGYPEGRKGEDIPLSARIMAVADVFDALVSRRCYKPGFSFEKSMDIIREEAGTHFDPLVAGAFLNAADEVRKVLDERQQEDESSAEK